MRLVTIYGLLPTLFSLFLVGCADPGSKESIQRPGNRQARLEAMGDLGKASQQSCGSNDVEILDLQKLSEQLRRNNVGDRSGRLTTVDLKLYTADSSPLSGNLTQAPANIRAHALVSFGLQYQSGRISAALETDPVFAVTSQQDCETVRFSNPEAANSVDSFDIDRTRSDETRLVLTDSRGETRIYRLLSGDSLEVTTYMQIESFYCGQQQNFLLQLTRRLDIGERIQRGVSIDAELLRFISSRMDLTSELEALTRGGDDSLTGSRISQESLVSDADYIDIAQRLHADREQFGDSQTTTHIQIPTCEGTSDETETPAEEEAPAEGDPAEDGTDTVE